jgi:hypothetical protein
MKIEHNTATTLTNDPNPALRATSDAAAYIILEQVKAGPVELPFANFDWEWALASDKNTTITSDNGTVYVSGWQWIDNALMPVMYAACVTHPELSQMLYNALLSGGREVEAWLEAFVARHTPNAKLRGLYFDKFPSPVCNSCQIDTSKKYPWVNRVLDLHHILPLSSGTRVDSRVGTILDDMAPICPTCHRAIHRYYDDYLKTNSKSDFDNKEEVHEIYFQAKQGIVKGDCYV